MLYNIKKRSGGYSLIEILISMGVFSAVVFGVVGIFIVSQESVQVGRNKMKAIGHLQDYMEKIKNIKRHDWSMLANGRYVFANNAGNWELESTVTGETLNNFSRFIEISDAYRDGSIVGPLVDTPGILDPSTKRIAVTVSWTGVKPGSVSEYTYTSRYLDSLTWEQTTEADFDAGTHNDTITVNDSGGEVVLGAGGGGNWCSPSLTTSSLDLPRSGIANSISALEGMAHIGTGENASGPAYVQVAMNNANPPALTVAGQLDGHKANDVYGESEYAYISTDTNSREIVIISTATTPYTEVGYFDPVSNHNSYSITTQGTTGYMVHSNMMRSFNLTQKTGARPQIGEVLLHSSNFGSSIEVQGSYAYVAMSQGNRKLQIIDISDPANMAIVGWVDIVSAQSANDVYVNETGTRAYIVLSESLNNREMHIVDISTKTGNRPILGSYETNGMSPQAIELVPGGRAIVVGTGGEEYQVLNVSNEAAPTRCGGMQVDSGIYDSASVLELDGDAFTYLVTGDANAEFKVVEGGPGGAFSAAGVYETNTLDAGHSTAFNRLEVSFDEPAQTDIRFQVAVVDPGLSGTCSDASFAASNFYGPDGTSATFFQDDGPVPFDDTGIGYENPGQCARVRAYLETSEFTQTPTLYDVSIIYSP